MVEEQYPEEAAILVDFFGAVAKKRQEMIWKELVARNPSPDYKTCEAFLRSLGEESDRAIPILLVAFIDARIEDMLSKELNPAVPGGPNRLLADQYGLAGTFGARVTLCQAVRWVSDDTAADLRLLGKVRNHFAHHVGANFDSDQVRGLLSSSLTFSALMAEARVDMRGLFVSDDAGKRWTITIDDEVRNISRTRRLDFMLLGSLALHRTLRELYVLPTAWKSGFGPGAFLGEVSGLRNLWPNSGMPLGSLHLLLYGQRPDGRACSSKGRDHSSPRKAPCRPR